MAKIAIVYHSGYGHTAKQAEAVAAGVNGVAGASAQLVALNDIAAVPWDDLAAADGIIFGAPTYMGGPSAKFKEFADASSKAWYGRTWQDKVAGGFTNSASLNGDKQGTLGALSTLAMQHGMIWVSLGLLPANSSTAQRNDVNRMGASFGAMAQSDSDLGADVVPPAGDLETSRLYGARVATTALRFVRGKA